MEISFKLIDILFALFLSIAMVQKFCKIIILLFLLIIFICSDVFKNICFKSQDDKLY